MRKRTARMVYEEPPLEDELDSKFFKSLRQQVKDGSVERIPVNGVATPTTTTENTNTGSVCNHEEEEEKEKELEEEDYMSDSWEAELFSLKRNPREKLRFQEEDNAILSEWFCRNPYPDKQEQSDIGKILMVPVKTVKHWFQTKRVKCKESGKVLRKKEDKRSMVMEGEARGEGGQKYCRLCRQSFSLSLHLKLHNKRFHKKKVKSKFISLLFSIWYFTNPFTPLHWAGTGLVFAGIILFSDIPGYLERHRNLTQKKQS